MKPFENLCYENELTLTVLDDAKKILPKAKGVELLNTYWPKTVIFNGLQQYVQKVSFYLVQTLTWCHQLDLAIEFLSNYDYSKN